jgi:hypothetical protein
MLQQFHAGCTRGAGSAAAFSMVAHSAPQPSSVVSIARSSHADRPPVPCPEARECLGKLAVCR